MSTLQWRDWSCTVRVVVADGRPTPDPALAARAEGLVRSLMDDVAAASSRFAPDSDLSRVNAAAGRLVPVRPLTLELLGVAIDAARRTSGACDPTVGRHLEHAGYDADIDLLRVRPPRTAADPAPRAADWRAVRVDRGLGLLGVPTGMALDLGATAKAWTADAAAALLARTLGRPALVALGGDVAVAGDGPAWPVLVSEREGGPGEVVSLPRGGLATSSTRARRWPGPDGERHHVIDPETGRPAASPLRTATVAAATCLEANTLSTAALVWGAGAPARLAAHAARWVTTDGHVATTALWPRSPRSGGVAA
ncbi:FAD:protein FMN transferase [Nocardioides soli]|uniref:FAD:protein FMN transferase n=1 Tax=Nocardioides soli TaxID=1036020 RepID=A0A7W4VXS8_9ACTN|nr:FAD:protein FMN transferase [Nocardioides soli]MBB3043779.1 thiamine biosynthesis lipoprotein [Nocardioides soli]